MEIPFCLPSRLPEARKKFYLKHRVKILEKDRLEYHENLEKERDRSKKYWETHKEEIKLKQRDFRKKNRDKMLLKRKEYYEKNKEKFREYSLIYRETHRRDIIASRCKKYGITLEQIDFLTNKQQGVCAICGKKSKTLCIDHCHRTSVVRGLLCHHCNRALGFFKDSPTILQSAINYLNSPPPDLTTEENSVK